MSAPDPLDRGPFDRDPFDRHGGVQAVRTQDERDEYDQVTDSDIDLHDPAQRGENKPRQWDLVAAIAIGGIIGAEARYGLDLAVPHTGRQFPWSTVIINASGCLLIGALMVVLLEFTSPHRLVRPLLGVGVLGGYTTYSTFAVDVQRLILNHRPLIALGYVLVTVFTCAAAVWLSTTVALAIGRAIIARRVTDRVTDGIGPEVEAAAAEDIVREAQP